MIKIAKKSIVKDNFTKIDWSKKTTLIMTILTVLVVVLVVVNFERFTGNVISGGSAVPKVYVSSKQDVISESNPVIKKGSNVYVTVETGSSGVKNPLSVYSKVKSTYYANDYYTYDRIGTVNLRYGTFGIGRASNCANNCNPGKTAAGYQSTSGTTWDVGTYCAIAEERYTNKKVEVCFTIE